MGQQRQNAGRRSANLSIARIFPGNWSDVLGVYVCVYSLARKQHRKHHARRTARPRGAYSCPQQKCLDQSTSTTTYDIQYDSIETKQNKNPSLHEFRPRTNDVTLSATTIVGDNLFHTLMTRTVKKCAWILILESGQYDVNECPLVGPRHCEKSLGVMLVFI